MAIPAIGAGAAAAAPQSAQDGAGAKFDNAVDNASTEDQLEEQMATQGVTVMGQIMMQRANEILGEAMEDDEG